VQPVSIPFIAGQWSLPTVATGAGGAGMRFQSPSLRGSGRFMAARGGCGGAGAGFNPLHCGAVVASRRTTVDPCPNNKFQSPSLRGSGRFERTLIEALQRALFQSPSLRGSGRFAGGQGARKWKRFSVSIPFIAGQWSLRGGGGAARRRVRRFQSPSLRGSGRFGSGRRPARKRRSSFNPLHCGAVVASSRSSSSATADSICFNPLHCGAVVASRQAEERAKAEAKFQSPSLRGSGRFPS